MIGRAAALAGCALAFVALAGPSWRSQPQPLWQDRAPLVIALDLSERVLATDLPPSRLQRARAKIAEILRRRGGGQLALVVYAGDAFTVTPMTEDGANIALYLDALHPSIMPARGSRTDRGIAESALLLKRADFPRGDILVITDMLDGDERRAENAASEAANQGYRVSVLGLASERGATRLSRKGGTDVIRLDGSALQALADEGKGRYAPIASDDSDLRALGILDAQHMDATSVGGKRGLMALDEGYWLLPLLMLAALFAFRRGVLVVALLCCLPWQPVRAAEGGLWVRSDQQQHRQMRAADEAYRKNDYENAERLWTALPNADAAYNRGNALARQGRYPEAIAAYDEALRRQPGMADAIENRRIVQEAMRKQKTPPQNDQQRDDKQKSKQKDKPDEGRDGQQNDQAQKPNDQQQDGGQPQKPGDRKQPPKNPQDDPNKSEQQASKDGRSGDPKNASGQGDQNRQQQNQQQQKQQNDQQQKQASQSRQNQQAQQGPGQDRANTAPGQQRDPAVPDAQSADPKAQREANAAQRASMDRALAQGARNVPAGKGEGGNKPMTAEERQIQILNEARLRRVPDDPGGLLRAKFSQQYRRRSSGDDRR